MRAGPLAVQSKMLQVRVGWAMKATRRPSSDKPANWYASTFGKVLNSGVTRVCWPVVRFLAMMASSVPLLPSTSTTPLVASVT
jgi:hypothetical protein